VYRRSNLLQYFTRRPYGDNIPKHAGAGFSPLSCHRVYLPIITNDDVILSVGDEDKNMLDTSIERTQQQLKNQGK